MKFKSSQDLMLMDKLYQDLQEKQEAINMIIVENLQIKKILEQNNLIHLFENIKDES